MHHDPLQPLSDAADVDRLFNYPYRAPLDGEGTLPDTYGRENLTLMVRDPFWLFAYWEITDGGATPPLNLTVYQTDEAGTSKNLVTSYRVGSFGGHHIPVPTGGLYYVAHLESEGASTPKLVSNVVRTPPGRPSALEDESWLTIQALHDWLYHVPAGPSSPGMSASLGPAWLAHGYGGSPSAASTRHPRLIRDLEVEVVVRGKTSPGASLTAGGVPVAVGPDGSFTLQTELRDDTLVLALRATDPSGERSVITPVFTYEKH